MTQTSQHTLKTAARHGTAMIILVAMCGGFSGCRMLESAGLKRKTPTGPPILSHRNYTVPAPYALPRKVAAEAVTQAKVPDPVVANTTGIIIMPKPLEPIVDVPPPPIMIKKDPIRVPTKKVELPKAPPGKQLAYTVKKGDTLSRIARMYGVSVAELAAENNIAAKNIHLIRVGKKLTIPRGGQYLSPDERGRPLKRPGKAGSGKISPPLAMTRVPNKNGAAPKRKIKRAPIPAAGKHIVKKGESLWKIARKYDGLTIHKLMVYNKLKGNMIHPGQALILKPANGNVSAAKGRAPVAVSKTGNTASGTVAAVKTPKLINLPHVVGADESLEHIAEMYGSTIEWIEKANPAVKGITDLKQGTELKIPIPDIEIN